MTTPDAARNATPGQRFTNPDGGTWVLTDTSAGFGANRPWAHYFPDGRFARGSQEEAEAAGLELLVAETEVPVLETAEPSHRRAVAAFLRRWEAADADSELIAAALDDDADLIEANAPWAGDDRPVAPAPLDPGNPEDLRTSEALRFAAAVMEDAARGRPQPATELMNARGLRDTADRLDRERAEAEQDAAEAAFVQGIFYRWCQSDGNDHDLIREAIRAERARVEETKP